MLIFKIVFWVYVSTCFACAIEIIAERSVTKNFVILIIQGTLAFFMAKALWGQ